MDKVNCPECRHEVEYEFEGDDSEDEFGFTVECPSCGHEFDPEMA